MRAGATVYASNPMIATINPKLSGVEIPPIAEAVSWVAGRTFPSHKPLIDLSQAVPGYPPDTRLTEYVGQQATDPRTSNYTPIEGLDDLRAALAAHMAHAYDGQVSMAQALITGGCNQAFFIAILSVASTGDAVIVPSPYYFNHKMTLDMLGIEARFVPVKSTSALVPEPEAAERLIDECTRAIVLVSPNNPTGAIYPPETIASFFALAHRRGLWLILDETYKDFLPSGPDPAHRLFSQPDWSDTLIQLYSFSKVFCLPGYRVGSLIASAELITEATKIMDCIAICAPHVGQRAALFGLRHLAAWCADKRDLMYRRMATFRESLTASKSRYRIAGLGAYFAYLEHPFEVASAVAVARHLAIQHNLLCLPGTTFGPGQERYLRLAFANVDSELIPEITRRLKDSEGDTTP